MNMKMFKAITALALLGASAPCEAFTAGERAVVFGQGQALFTPSTLPTISALFPFENAQILGIYNTGLKTNGGSQGAFYLPSGTLGTLKSWFGYFEGVVNPFISQNSSAGNEALLSGGAYNGAPGCSNSSCSSGANRELYLTSGGMSTGGGSPAFTFGITARNNSSQFWQTGSVIQSTFTGGSGYTGGEWQWTATGTGCTVAPSGWVGVNWGTSGVIQAARVNNPGSGCPTSGTFAVTAAMAPGIGGTSTNTIVTLTYGLGTGIVAKPGQRFCGVVGQWGSDAGSLNGQQFAAMVDNNGNWLTNSPVVATTVNNAGATDFYHSAGVLSTQIAIGDFFNLVGSATVVTGSRQNGWGGQVANVGMIWGVLPSSGGVPTRAMLAQLCQKGSNTDPLAYLQATFGSANVHSFYRLNDVGTWSDSTGHYAAATPLVAGTPYSGAPVAPSVALTLTDNGAGTVYPIPLGGSYGTLFVKGTYSTTALGGAPKTIQAQISASPGGAPLAGCSGSCSWKNIAANPSGGVFSGAFGGVPPGGPYYVSVRASNGKNYTISGNPVYVGLVLGIIGQSQQDNLFSPGSVGNALALAASVRATIVSTHDNAGGSSSNNSWAAFGNISATYGGVGIGAVNVRSINSNSVPGTTINSIGDGITAMVNGLSVLSGGWPIEVVNLTRTGNSVNSWADGYVTQTQTVGVGNGVTTAYSPTLAFATSSLGLGSNPPYLASGVANVMLAGTLKVYVAGALVCSDTSSPAITVYAGVCTGSGISTSSINYTTGAVSLTFSSPPASGAAITATWTNIVDIAPGAVAAPVVSSQYDGFDVFGNGTPNSGMTSGLMTRLPNGLTMVIPEQCTADESLFLIGGYANGALSQSLKWAYVLGKKFPATFGATQYPATTPVLALGYPRDTEGLGTTLFQNLNGCQQWTHDFGVSGSGYGYKDSAITSVLGFTPPAPLGFGGSYLDISDQDGNSGGADPHATSGLPGGQRMGRRMAANIWGFFKSSTLAQEPQITGAAFVASGSANSYDAACLASRYACIDITVSLNPAATTLQVCNPNSGASGLSGGTHPATGYCQPQGVGAVVEGFLIGPTGGSVPVMYADDGLDVYNVTFNANAASHNEYVCSIVAPTVIQCKKSVGAWSSGGTYLSFGNNLTVSRSGILKGTKTGIGYTVTTAGTCTGSGTAQVAMTGAGATPPKIQFTYTAGGGVSAAVPYFPGASTGLTLGWTTTPAVVLPSGCSGTVLSGVQVDSATTMDDYLGQLPYDDSARAGTTLNGIFSGTAAKTCVVTGVCEPGLPLTPYRVISPVSVSG